MVRLLKFIIPSDILMHVQGKSSATYFTILKAYWDESNDLYMSTSYLHLPYNERVESNLPRWKVFFFFFKFIWASMTPYQLFRAKCLLWR